MPTTLKSVFAEHGYNLVSLPKIGIQPLLLLYKSGIDVSSVESSLTTLFPIDEYAPPAIQKDTDVLPIIGNAEASFDAKAGVNFFQSLLEKLNMGKASAKLKVNDHDTLTFAFQDIKEDTVDLLSLDQFISGTKPDVDRFKSFGEKLKQNELYVVNSVLKSTSFTIKITDKSGQNVDIEANIKGMLEADVNISHAKNNSITLSHKNKQIPLVFAFKAQRIIYEKASFWSNKPANFRIINQPDITLRDTGNVETDELILGNNTATL